MTLRNRIEIRHALDRNVVQRALLMGAIVGSLLALINHGTCL